MVFPYDFPLTEKDMRVYIPNVAFRNLEDSKLKGVGVYTSSRNEELLLNYRWSNLEHQPEWYTPVDEEEDTTLSLVEREIFTSFEGTKLPILLEHN
ncbi:hypothetical protein G4B88_026985 [Cannabis sativa]|uniref:Uncharacterized protein n=1 Tax=Cannabis sativa TaxID=3483 RepID=A0A7J6DM12_CANSA|nr:hypothetical protein G4B88_026985 [Cannabis sativa]